MRRIITTSSIIPLLFLLMLGGCLGPDYLVTSTGPTALEEATNLREGMQTMEVSMNSLVEQGLVSYEDACDRSMFPNEIRPPMMVPAAPGAPAAPAVNGA